MAVVAVDLQAQCDALRSRLKEWERAHFSRTGAKASRKDIASDLDIATKYREYEKLRSALSGKQAPSRSDSSAKEPSNKRKSVDELPQGTPRKRHAQNIATPSAQRHADVEVAAEATPQSSIKQLIFGPTPQKEGVPLGIFDHLPTDILQATPSASRVILNDVNINVVNTPSKVVPATPEFEGSKFSRTPMSEGRRFMLDMFVTPRHKKDEPQKQKTPSTSDRLFQTPAFLRRHTAPMSILEEETSPQVKLTGPWRRSGFGRSLSSMIQDLRKQEDDRLDQEMDIMHQIEAEEDSERPAQPRKEIEFDDITPIKETMNAGLDEDGFIPSDIEAQLKELDTAEAAAAAKTGQPLRIYKKKGLKRQTRRVNMRPVRQRKKTANPDDAHDTSSNDSNDEDESNDVVPETQYDDLQDAEFDAEFDDEVEDVDTGTATKESIKKPAATKRTTNDQQKATSTTKGSEATKKRKVADRNNYCKLKIKNKNSKANGRGRFGRRR